MPKFNKERDERKRSTFYGKYAIHGTNYNWDPETQGFILSSFYYGYVATQLPGGILCERLGSKWLFGGGILITTSLYLFVPLAASWGVTAVAAIRILEGLGE
ncbi:hypothetical protein NPIL_404482, partial [Nephila pilipes]